MSSPTSTRTEAGARPPRLPVVAVAVPAMLLLVLIVAMLSAEAAGRSLVWFETPITLPEAAALRDAATVTRLIRDGHDPNRSGTVRPGVLRSDGYDMTPLEAAVAGRRPEMVRLLVAHGARLDRDTRPMLVCFSRDLGLTEIEAYLRAGGEPVASCDGVRKVRY